MGSRPKARTPQRPPPPKCSVEPPPATRRTAGPTALWHPSVVRHALTATLLKGTSGLTKGGPWIRAYYSDDWLSPARRYITARRGRPGHTQGTPGPDQVRSWSSFILTDKTHALSRPPLNWDLRVHWFPPGPIQRRVCRGLRGDQKSTERYGPHDKRGHIFRSLANAVDDSGPPLGLLRNPKKKT